MSHLRYMGLFNETLNVTVQLHPIFIRFALLTYRKYASEGETNESGAHLNSYILDVFAKNYKLQFSSFRA